MANILADREVVREFLYEEQGHVWVYAAGRDGPAAHRLDGGAEAAGLRLPLQLCDVQLKADNIKCNLIIFIC